MFGDFPEGVTYRLLVEYDGTDFCGWQLQDNVRTVQGCLEDALIPLFGSRQIVIGAGRTDAGVHAKGMVAHFKADGKRDPAVVLRALNANIPRDSTPALTQNGALIIIESIVPLRQSDANTNGFYLTNRKLKRCRGYRRRLSEIIVFDPLHIVAPMSLIIGP
jgi:hypothetical protein